MRLPMMAALLPPARPAAIDDTLPAAPSNVPPVLSAIESAALAYTEGDAATAITSAIVVADSDDTDMESAVVQIVGNYDSGKDLLEYSGGGGAPASNYTLNDQSSNSNNATAGGECDVYHGCTVDAHRVDLCGHPRRYRRYPDGLT